MSKLNKLTSREYGFTLIFYALAVYQFLKPNYLEMALYLLAGTAFGLMGLVKDGKFQKHKNLVDIISWTLVIITVFYFLFMLRNDSNL